jgi:dihydropyrimidine dehydrogenase (NAD+) subunit PreA
MSSDPNLAVEFCGLIFPNPFVLPSAQSVRTREMIRRAFLAGWGGAVTQTLFYDANKIRNVRPRLHAFRTEEEVVGVMNIELVTTRAFDDWLEDIYLLKREFPQRPLIASIMGTANRAQEWKVMTRQCTQAGADAIELNLSCPHGMPEISSGAHIGQDPTLTAEVTKWVVETTDVPVFVKLTPNVTDIVKVARAASHAGASGITAINNLKCLPGIDIERFDPLPAVHGYSSFGGYAGPGIKPVGLRCVAEIAKSVPEIPIMGTGGIGSWQDAVEYMLVGASIVQIYTVVMKRGFSVIDELVEGLQGYLHKKGFNQLMDIKGKVLPKIVPHMDLERVEGLVATLDTSQCVRCGICHIACEDSGFQAVTVDSAGIPSIDAQSCDGCGLCVTLCPVGCMRLAQSSTM